MTLPTPPTAAATLDELIEVLNDGINFFGDAADLTDDAAHARLFRDLRSDKRTVILCTHNLTEAEQLADHIAVIRRGAIIAQGSPQQLKRQWLGPALLELRTAGPLNGAVSAIASHARVVDQGPDWVRYLADAPEVTNPQVLASLAQQAVGVVTLAEVPRSLEDVYLQVVAANGSAPAP